MLITFSTGTTGLTPGYSILNADKSTYQARATAGITDLGGGEYGATVAGATLEGRTVLWDTGETPARYASEMFATDLAAIKTDTVLLVKGRFNKVISDPVTGHEIVYDDNSTTPLKTGDIYEDIAGTMPFDGTGANRRDRMT